ncbi:MAG TPA: M1 family metallopeptidase, partial [Longimicrobium sp.]|nr:M1 family metallopeptidase [Longimicrobium sp.]
MRRIALLAGLLAVAPLADAAAQADTVRFTRADTLRGSITPERAWWDVTFYDLHVRVSPADSTLRGRTGITYRVTGPAREMQIDLQMPLVVDSVVQDGRALRHRREGNAFFVTTAAPQRVGARKTVTVHYHGRPRVARNAPWDGGVVWARDTTGAAWVATAVQGLGASAWWPNKDTQVDEPDSQRVAVTVPDPMVNVSNGRLRSTRENADGTTTYEWFVQSPINNYDVAINAGPYAHFSDVYQGEKGRLTLDFWPLARNLEAARRQFQQVKPMLACFERWFGPFPWYEDGFKLVETPHLGMEHQSAVAYGNRYVNGYRGRDLSGTGLGLRWDFIIIHESGHEWFGNNITTRDIADMWVHEGFTSYSEGIYTECQQGKEAGARYIVGLRRSIQNDRPIVGPYGVNAKGSDDMYYKANNMLHTIRQVIGDDEKWRGILRGLNATFGRRTVTGRQVQDYISQQADIDLSRVFAQYLTTTQVPVLEWSLDGSTLRYRWANVVPGFDMPVRVTLSPGGYQTIRPTTQWQTVSATLPGPAAFRV